MDFLKKLFGGGGGESGDASGMYFYVQPNGCDEVIRVRIDRNNDLSISENEADYWVRKMVRGSSYKCKPVEMTLYFDGNRNLQNTDVQGGELVSQKEYQAWVESQQTDHA